MLEGRDALLRWGFLVLTAEAVALAHLGLELVGLGALVGRQQLVDLRLHLLALDDQVGLGLRLLIGKRLRALQHGGVPVRLTA